MRVLRKTVSTEEVDIDLSFPLFVKYDTSAEEHWERYVVLRKIHADLTCIEIHIRKIWGSSPTTYELKTGESVNINDVYNTYLLGEVSDGYGVSSKEEWASAIGEFLPDLLVKLAE